VVQHQVVDHSTANKNILVERHLEHSPAVTPRASTPNPCRTSVFGHLDRRGNASRVCGNR
jgi:hypothetical protein